jgi:glycosyltransferase involved in cell wall biosynthesis
MTDGSELRSEAVMRGNGVEGAPTPAVHAQFGLAHGWLRIGRLDLAARQFQKVIELDPDLEDPYVQLAEIQLAQHRSGDAIATCEAGLSRFPNQSKLHKLLVTALRESAGHAAVTDRYGLVRVDTRRIDIAPGAILSALVVRNEAVRLPWFLQECRRIGVDRFLAVDNGSTDGTLELLQAQPDVHVWQTSMSFNAGNFGSAWFEVLLREHGVGHWVVMLDADEVLCFPDYERRSLRDLCDSLERAGKDAASGLLIDMYSDRPIAETKYRAGDDFLAHAPFFDRTAYHEARPEHGPFANQTFYFGGLRKRVFGDAAEYLVTKVPLLRYQPDVVLSGGQHWTSHPADRIAHDACAVLHFKYFASFVDYAREEARREAHSEGGRQYKAYDRRLRSDEALTLYSSAESVRFEGSSQLVDLGFIDAEGAAGARAVGSTPVRDR